MSQGLTGRSDGLKSPMKRVAQLDSLRGIAAMLVVLHHVPQAIINDVNDATTGLSGYLDVGRMGVVIFFMISGFVIVKAIPGNTARSIRLFWKHRFFRLFPAFWISVFVATIVAQTVATSNCCAFVVPATRDVFIANMTMIPLRMHEPMLIGVYWSLELELFFYALISVITVASCNNAKIITRVALLAFVGAIAAAMVTTVKIGAGEIGKDQLFLALLHLSLMFAGGAVRYHWDEQATRISFLRTMPTPLKAYFLLQLGFFTAVAAVKLRHGIEPHTFRVAATYLLGIGAFLACLRYFDGSWLGTFMGNRSYGIYLIHVPVLSLLSYVIVRGIIPPLGYTAYLAVVLVVTLILADMMRRFVERPSIRLGHMHDRWMASRKMTPAMIAASIIVMDDRTPPVVIDLRPPSEEQAQG
jgi:peptidoglycan/LPS O-acetylase OafA/YrhL